MADRLVAEFAKLLTIVYNRGQLNDRKENQNGGRKTQKVEKVRFQFDPHIELDFEGGQISSDTGLLLYREFEEKMELMDLVKANISFKRPYRTHSNIDCIRQQVYSLLGDHEDNNDATITQKKTQQ